MHFLGQHLDLPLIVLLLLLRTPVNLGQTVLLVIGLPFAQSLLSLSHVLNLVGESLLLGHGLFLLLLESVEAGIHEGSTGLEGVETLPDLV